MEVTDEKNLLYQIAIHLPPIDILLFCRLGKKYNICDDMEFWKDKFYYDYGELYNAENWKGLYERTSKTAIFRDMSYLSIIDFMKRVAKAQIKYNDSYIPQVLKDLDIYISTTQTFTKKQALSNMLHYYMDIIDPLTDDTYVQHKIIHDTLNGKETDISDDYKNNAMFMSLYL